MKKILLRIGSIVAALILIVCSLIKVSSILQLKESDNRYAAFFDSSDEYDVLFIGSSHVRHGIFPMELWNNYGITSYNLAGDGDTIPISYWTLVNALDYHKPKVVVMDVFDMWPGRVFSESWGQVHSQFDAFPMSYHKYQMVNDLFSDKTLTDGDGNYVYDKRWELLFDMGAYHTRWTELKEEDFVSKEDLVASSKVWKGAEPYTKVVERLPHEYSQGLSEDSYDNLAKEYLEKTIRLCQDKNIDIMLINTGYECSDESKLFHDSVGDIADSYGVVYLDFTKENIINFGSDLNDSGFNTHVNFSGACRQTDYLGTQLKNRYSLIDHRGEEGYSTWDDEYVEYANSKLEYLDSQDELLSYMVLLRDTDYRILIEVRDKGILDEYLVANMFDNLGLKSYGDSDLICVDAASGDYDYTWCTYESGYSADILLGQLSLFSNDEGVYGMYLNGEELYTVDPEDNPGRIYFTVYSKNEDSIVNTKSF